MADHLFGELGGADQRIQIVTCFSAEPFSFSTASTRAIKATTRSSGMSPPKLQPKAAIRPMQSGVTPACRKREIQSGISPNVSSIERLVLRLTKVSLAVIC